MSREARIDAITFEEIPPENLVTLNGVDLDINTLAESFKKSTLEEPLNPFTRQPLPEDIKKRVVDICRATGIVIYFIVDGVSIAVKAREPHTLGWFINQFYLARGHLPHGMLDDDNVYSTLGWTCNRTSKLFFSREAYSSSSFAHTMFLIASFLEESTEEYNGLADALVRSQREIEDHRTSTVLTVRRIMNGNKLTIDTLPNNENDDIFWILLEKNKLTLELIKQRYSTYKRMLGYCKRLIIVTACASNYNPNLDLSFGNHLTDVINALRTFKEPGLIRQLAKLIVRYDVTRMTISRAIAAMTGSDKYDYHYLHNEIQSPTTGEFFTRNMLDWKVSIGADPIRMIDHYPQCCTAPYFKEVSSGWAIYYDTDTYCLLRYESVYGSTPLRRQAAANLYAIARRISA